MRYDITVTSPSKAPYTAGVTNVHEGENAVQALFRAGAEFALAQVYQVFSMDEDTEDVLNLIMEAADDMTVKWDHHDETFDDFDLASHLAETFGIPFTIIRLDDEEITLAEAPDSPEDEETYPVDEEENYPPCNCC